MAVLYFLVAVVYLPTIILYGMLAIGVPALIISFLMPAPSLRRVGTFCVTIPIALYAAAYAVAMTREQLIRPQPLGANPPTRLVMQDNNFGDDWAVIYLAKGGLNSVIMRDKGRLVEATINGELEDCQRLVDRHYRWYHGGFGERRSRPYSRESAPLLAECLRTVEISKETVERVLAEEDNLVLLSNRATTVGHSPTLLLDIKTDNGVYELRRRGPQRDVLVGYWQTYAGYPGHPPIASWKGFTVEGVRHKGRRYSAGTNHRDFILYVLGKGAPQKTAKRG